MAIDHAETISRDPETKINVFIPLGYNGSTALEKSVAVSLKTKIYTDATYTYVCEAAPNAALNSAVWRISRIVNSTGDLDFANSDSAFDNLATDLSTVQGIFA